MRNKYILIISEDHVFITLTRRLLIEYNSEIKIKIHNSFSSVKSISSNGMVDMIILDNSITGAANHEIVSFLRLKQNILAPVFYFSNSENDEDIAMKRGANYFVKKPFSPTEIIKMFDSTLIK